MRGYQVHEHGEPAVLVIDAIPTPEPGPGEIRVQVHAAGLNFPDLLVISGAYQLLPPRPFTPGKDLAGVVSAVGAGVSDYAVGDRIMSQVEHGALAEQAITTPANSFRLPEGLGYADAAAMGLVYQTAWFALVERGHVRRGERVLISGAAGGVGLAAVQIAKGLGYTVLAGVRSDEDKAFVRECGADHVIDLGVGELKESLREQVFAATGGHGVDVVIDNVGGPFLGAALRAMAWCGRLVVVGFAAGEIPTVKVNYLLLKNISISGLQWSDYRDRAPDKVRAAQDELFRLWSQGAVQPKVMKAFDFEEAPQALEWLRDGKVQGKVVVTVRKEV